MLQPGTFLGVWNLVSISGGRAAESISPALIQAHGHAQVLGWIAIDKTFANQRSRTPVIHIAPVSHADQSAKDLNPPRSFGIE